MKWAEVVNEVAVSSGVSAVTARRVLENFVVVVGAALAEQDEVLVPKLGKFTVKWTRQRTFRSVVSGRRSLAEGHFAARFRSARSLREHLRGIAPQPVGEDVEVITSRAGTDGSEPAALM